MIYKKNIEENYIKDFESSMDAIATMSEEDPNFLIENLDKIRVFNSHLF